MAIYNTKKSLNYEIRAYGETIQKAIVFDKAKTLAGTYEEMLDIYSNLIMEVE